MQSTILFSMGLAIIGGCFAAPAVDPSCEPQQGLMPCAMPIIMFAMTPEGQEFTKIKDGQEISSSQLTTLCRLSQSASQCLNGFVERCAAGSLPNIREILQGTTKLLRVCDSPTLYPDAKVLMQCTKKMNTTGSKLDTCSKQLERKYASKGQSAQTMQNAGAAEMDLEAGKMLGHVCCAYKDIKACLGNEVQDKCGAEAARLNSGIDRAFMEAFNCAAKQTKCSA